MISFSVRKHEQRIIADIADRASSTAGRLGIEYDRRDAMMDLTATHANGCPLRLEELLNAEQFHFVHDILGIRRHLNRTTGELEHCFVPRFAKLTPPKDAELAPRTDSGVSEAVSKAENGSTGL